MWLMGTGNWLNSMRSESESVTKVKWACSGMIPSAANIRNDLFVCVRQKAAQNFHFYDSERLKWAERALQGERSLRSFRKQEARRSL